MDNSKNVISKMRVTRKTNPYLANLPSIYTSVPAESSAAFEKACQNWGLKCVMDPEGINSKQDYCFYYRVYYERADSLILLGMDFMKQILLK